MNTTIDREFASALRATPLEPARPQRTTTRRSYRRTTFIGLGTVVGLVVLGAAAAAVFGLPGVAVEKSLTAPVELSTTGRASVYLGEAPKGANAVHFEFQCNAPGTYVIDDAGVVLMCDMADVKGPASSGMMSLNAVKDGSISVTAGGGSWSLRAWYVDTNRAPLAKNKNGETYGVDSEEARPDLIHVDADNGTQGYVRRSELERAEGPAPTSPAQAGTQTPRLIEIPVYEYDGKTVVGSFTVEGYGR